MIRDTFALFGQTLRDGIRIWWLAPLIPALVVVPEFLQHVAEIRIGMFDSREAARTLSDDPRRMVWGYLKIAGLVLAFLASIRFWGAWERGQRWWDVRGVAWKGFLVAIALLAATSLPGTLVEPSIGAERAGYIDIALALATLPLMVMLVAALGGAREASLRDYFRHGWWPAVRMLLFAAATWAPLQWLHGQNHMWAMGQHDAVVWALMVFDSLVVGLLATMAGTAFHHGGQIEPVVR